MAWIILDIHSWVPFPARPLTMVFRGSAVEVLKHSCRALGPVLLFPGYAGRREVK
jgi:hypothetical protein